MSRGGGSISGCTPMGMKSGCGNASAAGDCWATALRWSARHRCTTFAFRLYSLAIDASISTESGRLSVKLPYRMLEFFELTASGQVYYRVATDDALVEIGKADQMPR